MARPLMSKNPTSTVLQSSNCPKRGMGANHQQNRNCQQVRARTDRLWSLRCGRSNSPSMGTAHAAHTVCAGEDLEGCGVLLRPPRAADANGLARAEAFALSSLLAIQAGLPRG